MTSSEDETEILLAIEEYKKAHPKKVSVDEDLVTRTWLNESIRRAVRFGYEKGSSCPRVQRLTDERDDLRRRVNEAVAQLTGRYPK